MSPVGRKIVDNSKAGGGKIKKGRVIESDRKKKEEITSTEFPEGGNTTSTKGPPASQQATKLSQMLYWQQLGDSVYVYTERGHERPNAYMLQSLV